MRGKNGMQYSLPICDPGEHLPVGHPLRTVKAFVDSVLERMRLPSRWRSSASS
jgi:hypothetical protein